MPTRIAIQRELCRRLYAGKFDPVTGTNTSTTTTIITDLTGDLNYASGDTHKYDGKHVYVTTSADAARGRSRVIRDGWAVTGSLTIDPAITGLASGDLFILSDDHPLVIQQNIDRILRNLYVPSFFPLSIHIVQNDANDMEPSTVATDYSATNGTRALETTIVHNGSQSLKLTATSAGGYANLDAVIGVNDGEPLYAAVMCYVTSGDSATFRVIDVTNSNATIDDATSDEPKWMELFIPFTVPANSEQIDLRMISDADTDVAYWEDVQVWRGTDGIYTLPSWVTWPEQIIGVRYFPLGAGGPNDNDYRGDERRSRPLRWGVEREDLRADKPLRIWCEGTGGGRPYIQAYRPLAALTADDSTTSADLDAIAEHVLFIMRNPERADRYLAGLRWNVMGGAISVPSERVGMR